MKDTLEQKQNFESGKRYLLQVRWHRGINFVLMQIFALGHFVLMQQKGDYYDNRD